MDIASRHLIEAHIGRKNSPVAALIENKSILPDDVEFYDQEVCYARADERTKSL